MRQKQDVFLSVFAVALLAEGVDRNMSCMMLSPAHIGSPSTRRGGLEI